MADKTLDNVNKITKLTPSQEDRPNIGSQAQDNLLKFLGGFMNRTTAKNELQDKVDSLIMEKIDKDMEEEGIDGLNWGIIFKLKDMMGKHEVDSAMPLLKIIESATKTPDSFILPAGKKDEDEKEGDQKVSKEDYASAKKFLDIVRELKGTEFSEGEKA